MRNGETPPAAEAVAAAALECLNSVARSTLRPVFNLTGTVLHTNLGRAVLAEAAIDGGGRARCVRRWRLNSTSLAGRRGERDDHVRGLLCELTGAEDATVVNNNAAAVLLVLNTLRGRPRGHRVARRIDRDRRRVPHARHHGARRRAARRGRHHQPHASPTTIAARSAPRPALMLKVHTSNYRIEGFTAEVGAARSRRDRARRNVPLVQRSRLRHAGRSLRAAACRTSRPCARRSRKAPTS